MGGHLPRHLVKLHYRWLRIKAVVGKRVMYHSIRSLEKRLDAEIPSLTDEDFSDKVAVLDYSVREQERGPKCIHGQNMS